MPILHAETPRNSVGFDGRFPFKSTYLNHLRCRSSWSVLVHVRAKSDRFSIQARHIRSCNSKEEYFIAI